MTSFEPFQDLSRDPVVVGLNRLLSELRDERVVVLGPTCTGKTTMLPHINGAVDQDKEVFSETYKRGSRLRVPNPLD